MTETDYQHHLPIGAILGEYRIEKILGEGGFGVTYLVTDINLQKQFAIKEYLPGEVAARSGKATVVPRSESNRDDFEWGLERFLDEARTLATFHHPHLNQVQRFFKVNGTAYMVLEYIEGETLSHRLKKTPVLPETELRDLLEKLLDGLSVVHKGGYTHRDIKPGNIMIRPDGSPVLLDFGAARQALGYKSKSITTILTPGYAPIEQYDTKAANIGPWTDIYSLGMVAYRCISGQGSKELMESPSRAIYKGKGQIERDMLPAVELGKGKYSEELLKSIDWAINVYEEDRPQSVVELQNFFKQDLPGVEPFTDDSFVSPTEPEDVLPRGLQDEGALNTTVQENGVAAEKREGMDFGWKIVIGISIAFAVLIFFGSVLEKQPAIPQSSLESQTKPQEEIISGQSTLTVKSVPSNAEIRILNITPKYQAGITLNPGKYHIEASAQGYVTKDEWVTLPAGGSYEHTMTLATSAVHGEHTGDTYTEPTTGMEFVFVKGGCYQMGDTFGDGDSFFYEKPVHEVCVDSFWMGKYEATQGEYQKITGNNPSHFQNGDRYPVERVSWDDSQNFARQLSVSGRKLFRLPTEAEWEYAARSGGKSENYAGANNEDTVAWDTSNSGGKTHSVGQKQANGLGLFDMSGNVREWCSDWYGDNYYASSPRNNPQGPSSGSNRVNRGGGWGSYPSHVRSTFRVGNSPDDRYGILGFRLVFSQGS